MYIYMWHVDLYILLYTKGLCIYVELHTRAHARTYTYAIYAKVSGTKLIFYFATI